MTEIKALMAGTMWKILVEEGATVEKGEEIAVLESMKIEIPLATETAGVVQEIKVKEGEFIDQGKVIAVIK